MSGRTVAAAAAKSLQLCLTLCDPIDSSLQGSLVPRILQARTLEWVCLFLLQCVKVNSLSRVQLVATPWTAAYQAPLSMGFSRQECCRKGDPYQGPKLGSCLTLGNELSEETHVLTKQEILLGKGTRVVSSRVREPRRTVLPHGSQSRVLW